MLAAVERLAVAVDARDWIRRFRRIVAVYACLRGGSALQPVAIVVGAVARQRADAPAVNSLAGIGDGLVDLALAFLHAQADLQLVLQRESLEVEGLARPDADARELSAYLCLVLLSGRELQGEVEEFEEVRLHELLVDFRKIDGWRRQRRRLLQVGGKRLHLVAGLDLLDVVEVVRVEKLGAISRQRQL